MYLDDIVIFSECPEEHLVRLEHVVKPLQNANLKGKLPKCNFFPREVVYFGHLVTFTGMKPYSFKLNAFKNYPLPKSINEIRSFLEFTSFGCSFISGYSTIAEPLRCLLTKNATFKWTSLQQDAFDQLRNLLMPKTILQYPDYSNGLFLLPTLQNMELDAF